MILKTPFNKNILYHQHKLNFDVVWKENLKVNKRRIIFGIISVTVGSLIVFGEDNMGFLFIGLGIHYLVNFYQFWAHYSKNKKRYFKEVQTEIEGFENNEQINVFEFTNDYLGYSDYKHEAKLKWFAFKGYRLIEDTLFIDLHAKNGISYIISKSEIHENQWDEILSIVKEKIKL